jgi:hypothetical protein
MNLVAPKSRNFVKKIFAEGIRGDRSLCEFKFSILRKDGRIFECDTLVIFIPYKWGMAIQGTLWEAMTQKNIDSSREIIERIETAVSI